MRKKLLHWYIFVNALKNHFLKMLFLFIFKAARNCKLQNNRCPSGGWAVRVFVTCNKSNVSNRGESCLSWRSFKTWLWERKLFLGVICFFSGLQILWYLLRFHGNIYMYFKKNNAFKKIILCSICFPTMASFFDFYICFYNNTWSLCKSLSIRHLMSW